MKNGVKNVMGINVLFIFFFLLDIVFYKVIVKRS